MKSSAIISIISIVVIGIVSFYAGTKYQENQKPQNAIFNSNGNPRGQLGQRFGRPITGDIISQDDKSITVKMPDSSSKIIFLSDSTQYNQNIAAQKNDLKIGNKIAVFGTQNSDGSITAQNIQLNPQMRGIMENQSPSPR